MTEVTCPQVSRRGSPYGSRSVLQCAAQESRHGDGRGRRSERVRACAPREIDGSRCVSGGNHRGHDPGEQSRGWAGRLWAAATFPMEWVDADRPGVSFLSFYCGRGHGFFLSLAEGAGRFPAEADGARGLAQPDFIRVGHVSEWVSQSLPVGVVAGLWRAAEDRGLLSDHLGPGALDQAAGSGIRRAGLSGWLLDRDAIYSGAGLRCSRPRHSFARSGPQSGSLAGPQTSVRTLVGDYARSGRGAEHASRR